MMDGVNIAQERIGKEKSREAESNARPRAQGCSHGGEASTTQPAVRIVDAAFANYGGQIRIVDLLVYNALHTTWCQTYGHSSPLPFKTFLSSLRFLALSLSLSRSRVVPCIHSVPTRYAPHYLLSIPLYCSMYSLRTALVPYDSVFTASA
jgi:hypothetical protein